MAPLLAEEREHHLSRELTRTELLQQLERIVTSSHFRNSKRYPSFLRYVVEHTVDEDHEVLKERNLGVEIFGRRSDYDTNADPIVRVTAGEVRKRIAQYYQAPGREHELRIDLPLGSYVPHFYPAHPAEAAHHVEQAAASEAPALSASPFVTAKEEQIFAPNKNEAMVAATQEQSRTVWAFPKRWLTVAILATLSCFLLGGLYAISDLLRTGSQGAGIQYFWQSFAPPSKSALIVMGVHSLDSSGKPVSTESYVAPTRSSGQSALASMEASDMVPVSDIVSYSKLTDLLTRRSLPYRTKGSADTSLEELRNGPVILIGGFNNVWTMRLTSALRYRLVPEGFDVNGIVDTKNPSTVWLFDNLQPALSNGRDYAIVASYYDTTIEQHVVIAAGIGKNGTVAASEFLSTNKYLENWLAEAKIASNKNIELVLSTNVLDGEPGPPHVVAFTTW